MRKIIARAKRYLKNYSYIRKVKQHVKEKLRAQRITLSSIGGADINFLVEKDNSTYAMMRLAVIDHDDNPFVIDRFNKSQRLKHEKQVYTACGQEGLTPKLLFADENCTVCQYIDGPSAEYLLKNNQIDFYQFYEEALQLYVDIHSKGFSHLDATLKNLFFDKKAQCFKAVDFEYYAKPTFNFEAQKIYDYLRLTEYSLRKYGGSTDKVIYILEKKALAEYQNIDLRCCQPHLDRLNSIEPIKAYLEQKNIVI